MEATKDSRFAIVCVGCDKEVVFTLFVDDDGDDWVEVSESIDDWHFSPVTCPICVELHRAYEIFTR